MTVDAIELRRRWLDRETTLGGWCSIPDPFVTELMGRSGFDWVCLDMQHGLVDLGDLLPMLQAADAARIPALVRVPEASETLIGPALDRGACGVIVPMIESAADAESAVRAARYPPYGRRSYGPTRAAVRDPSFTAANGGERALVVAMVETRQAVAHIEDIMDVTGVDALFVGPADLELSLAGPSVAGLGTTDDLIREVFEAGRRRGMPVGLFCFDEAMAVRYAREGVAMVAVMSDVRLLRQAATSTVERVRGQAPQR